MTTDFILVDLNEWNWQHDRCQCCGILRRRAFIEPDWERKKVEPHHIIKRGIGGTDEDCNLLCLCWRCHHQGAHNGHSRWNLTLGELLWVKKTCGDGEWDFERLIEMNRNWPVDIPDKHLPQVLPAVYLAERTRFGYVEVT